MMFSYLYLDTGNAFRSSWGWDYGNGRRFNV